VLVGPGRVPIWRRERDAANRDFQIIEQILEEAEDAAVWEGNVTFALKLLREARSFSQQKVASMLGADEKRMRRYRVLSERAKRWIQGVTMQAPAYLHEARKAARRTASLQAYALLQKAAAGHLTVEIPGGKDVHVESPGGEFEVFAFILDSQSGEKMLAPWLYGLAVTVLRPRPVEGGSASVSVTGLPIALVNASTDVAIPAERVLLTTSPADRAVVAAGTASAHAVLAAEPVLAGRGATLLRATLRLETIGGVADPISQGCLGPCSERCVRPCRPKYNIRSRNFGCHRVGHQRAASSSKRIAVACFCWRATSSAVLPHLSRAFKSAPPSNNGRRLHG